MEEFHVPSFWFLVFRLETRNLEPEIIVGESFEYSV
jgi:hypothetical protein